MVLLLYALVLVLLALLPAALMRSNLPLFCRLPTAGRRPTTDESESALSVLVPARNEQEAIGACLNHILACDWPDLEVIVMDDQSQDETLAICKSKARSDPRLKVLSGGELPMGWNGKQRACWQMALEARHPWLLFLDADVRLAPDALDRLRQSVSQGGRYHEVDLLSGFPRQVTGTWMEKLLIPQMFFILLGYLPLARMRASPGPEFAAGCGQLFLARRSAYMTCEGHKAICQSRHDGVKLPRAFRRQAFKTDIFDASDLASCRMYSDARQVVAGLLKNATEGIGNPRTILIFTILLAGAAVLPLPSLALALVAGWNNWAIGLLAIATALSFLPPLWVASRFQYSRAVACLHPLSVLMFLVLQWVALLGQWCGMRVAWRGRTP